MSTEPTDEQIRAYLDTNPGALAEFHQRERLRQFGTLVAAYRLTCGACPTQYEGTTNDGRVFYFRYRSGVASLGFGTTMAEAVEDSFTRELRHGDQLDGSLGEGEFQDLFVRLATDTP